MQSSALSLLLCSPFFIACVSDPPAPEPPVELESVKPGINDSFLGDEFDLQKFIDRFEGESREIAREHRGLAETLHLEPGMEIADIGAGTGLFLPEFSRRVGAQGRVYAVDIAPGFLEHLAERIAEESLSNVTGILCTERSAELEPNSVDRIFVCDTYHHFEYPRSTLWSLHRALRKNGEMVVVDFERIPGVTRDWLMDHVRAGKEVFMAEILEAGFELIEEVDFPELEENYVLRFRKQR